MSYFTHMVGNWDVVALDLEKLSDNELQSAYNALWGLKRIEEEDQNHRLFSELHYALHQEMKKRHEAWHLEFSFKWMGSGVGLPRLPIFDNPDTAARAHIDAIKDNFGKWYGTPLGDLSCAKDWNDGRLTTLRCSYSLPPFGDLFDRHNWRKLSNDINRVKSLHYT